MPMSEKKKDAIRQQAIDTCRKYFPDSTPYLDDYVSCEACGKSPAYVRIVFYTDGRVFYDLCYRSPGKSNVYFIPDIKSLNEYLEHLQLYSPGPTHTTCRGCGLDFEPEDPDDTLCHLCRQSLYNGNSVKRMLSDLLR